MKLALFGGTRGVGLSFVQQALAAGHQVTTLVRSRDPNQLPSPLNTAVTSQVSNLHIVIGDALNADDVDKVIAGNDAVIVSLGTRPNAPKRNICSVAQKLIQASMRRNNVRRLIVVTSIGVGESWNTQPWLVKFFFKNFLKEAITDKFVQERIIVLGENSTPDGSTGVPGLSADGVQLAGPVNEEEMKLTPPLDWTIVRPGSLHNSTATDKWKAVENLTGSGRTGRAKVAAFILAECLQSDNKWMKKIVNVLDC